MASSFELDHARIDWERTAVLVWVLEPPRGTDRFSVESAFRREFGIGAAQLAVSKHFPEPYMIKFDTAGLRDEVLRKDRASFKRYGLDIHCRPYRAVGQAFNADLQYRVHLAVDGLPPFSWRPETVDRVIGRRCAVQSYDDGFTTMENTSYIAFWSSSLTPTYLVSPSSRIDKMPHS